MDKKEIKDRKFKVGDRVVYNAREAGCGWMNGMRGTVVFVDGTRCPYTVEFDDKLPGGLTDERVKTKRYVPVSGRHWFCQEANLEREGTTS